MIARHKGTLTFFDKSSTALFLANVIDLPFLEENGDNDLSVNPFTNHSFKDVADDGRKEVKLVCRHKTAFHTHVKQQSNDLYFA